MGVEPFPLPRIRQFVGFRARLAGSGQLVPDAPDRAERTIRRSRIGMTDAEWLFKSADGANAALDRFYASERMREQRKHARVKRVFMVESRAQWIIRNLRSALEFYAAAENYFGKDHYSSPSQDFPAWTDRSAVEADQGASARLALEFSKR